MRRARAGPSKAIRNAYVDLAAGQIHCRLVEGRGPAILFLHQTASSSGSYVPLLRALALPNPLVAIDTPGFGGSYDPPGSPAMRDYGEQIVATAAALGHGSFHLFGHHTGASLAIDIAAHRPERVVSIMLAGPVFMTADERTQFAAGYERPIAPQRDGSHLQLNWDYAARHNPDCDVELLHGEVVAMLRAWRGRAQAYSAVARHDPAALLPAVRAPALLLTSPDDFFHATFDRARALLPDARIAVTAGGNFQPSADPDGVARAIEGFLAALPAVAAQGSATVTGSEFDEHPNAGRADG